VSRFAIPRFPIYHHFGRIETDKYRATGEVLAASSRRMGLTQQEFAKQLGNPQSFVSQYESGQHQVDAVELVVVADTPGIKPVDLFSEVGNTVKQWVRPARQRWHVRVDDAGRGSGDGDAALVSACAGARVVRRRDHPGRDRDGGGFHGHAGDRGRPL
jgi:hypothetical protein